ncbi:MAG: hypothetical protein M3Y21_11390 [Candidatus Eremiobacteraeota bacterium]|nr:hypothetical protein [Candidatus Eremiobacteraeota bacterium]
MTAPPIVVQAAQLAAKDHVGVISLHLRQTSEIKGGPIHQSSRVELVGVFDGEKLVRVRVLALVENGRVADDEARAAKAEEILKGQNTGGFAVPFDARHFGEYRYRELSPTLVQFTSILRDADHGDGRFELSAGGQVIKLEYTPDVMPKYATAGTVTQYRAEVLPDFWATVRGESRYTGHYGFISGSGNFGLSEDHFRRYVTLKDAIAEFEAHRL